MYRVALGVVLERPLQAKQPKRVVYVINHWVVWAVVLAAVRQAAPQPGQPRQPQQRQVRQPSNRIWVSRWVLPQPAPFWHCWAKQ